MELGLAFLQEKTRAAAAPRKPKKGAVSSPLNVDDILVFAKFSTTIGRDLRNFDLWIFSATKGTQKI